MPPSSYAFQSHVIRQTRFLHRKTYPQNHEITVVGWDHRRSNPLLEAGLLVLGIASCQGLALNNLYSQPVEGKTATPSCCSVLISFYSGIQTHPALCCRDMSLPAVNVQKKKPVSHYFFFLLLPSLYLFFATEIDCKLTHILGDITSFPPRQVAEATRPWRCLWGVEISWCTMGFADCHPGRF